MKDKIRIVNKDGSVIEFDVLCSFELEDKMYVIYTDYSKDQEENIQTYSAQYLDGTLLPIKDEAANEIVLETIRTLNNPPSMHK